MVRRIQNLETWNKWYTIIKKIETNCFCIWLRTKIKMNHRVFSKENYYLITNILINVHMFLLNFTHIYFSFLYLQIRVSKISQPTNIQHPIPITTHNIKQSPLSEPPFQQTKNLQQRNTDLLLIPRPGYQTTQADGYSPACFLSKFIPANWMFRRAATAPRNRYLARWRARNVLQRRVNSAATIETRHGYDPRIIYTGFRAQARACSRALPHRPWRSSNSWKPFY